MVRKMQVMLEDDLSGALLEEGAGETISFGLDGTSYEIDLSADNAAQMHQAFSRYVAAGRKVTQPRRGAVGGARRGVTGSGRADLAAIREWAKAHGYEVSERGRIKNTVIEAYHTAR